MKAAPWIVSCSHACPTPLLLVVTPAGRESGLARGGKRIEHIEQRVLPARLPCSPPPRQTRAWPGAPPCTTAAHHFSTPHSTHAARRAVSIDVRDGGSHRLPLKHQISVDTARDCVRQDVELPLMIEPHKIKEPPKRKSSEKLKANAQARALAGRRAPRAGPCECATRPTGPLCRSPHATTPTTGAKPARLEDGPRRADRPPELD